jgi:hypothetical protein
MIWKSVWPDFRKMTAETGLYRNGDANCCPTGGRALIALKVEQNRLVATDIKIVSPPEKN